MEANDSMNEIRREGGYWSVYVDGVRMVDRESHAVANRIVEALNNPGCHYPSEADEVATSIMKWQDKAAAYRRARRENLEVI